MKVPMTEVEVIDLSQKSNVKRRIVLVFLTPPLFVLQTVLVPTIIALTIIPMSVWSAFSQSFMAGIELLRNVKKEWTR